MTVTAARFPFVAKADILRADRPAESPTDRRFRTLRQRGVVSSGLAIRRRRGGRVVGQLRCYAAINLDAVTLARHGQTERAIEIAEQAEAFEEDWLPLVESIAVEHDLEDFESFRALRNQLVHQLAPATEALEGIHRQAQAWFGSAVREQFVQVGETSGAWANLLLLSADQHRAISLVNAEHQKAIAEIVRSLPKFDLKLTAAIQEIIGPLAQQANRLAVDAFLPLAANLQLGDVAVLRVEHAAGGSLLSLLPAAAETGEPEEDDALDPELAAYFADEPLPDAAIADVEQRRSAGEVVVIPPTSIALAS